MPRTPEAKARVEIDRLLTAAGWLVCDVKGPDIHAKFGVALPELQLLGGHRTADYPDRGDKNVARMVESIEPEASDASVGCQSGKLLGALTKSPPHRAGAVTYAAANTGASTQTT